MPLMILAISISIYIACRLNI